MDVITIDGVDSSEYVRETLRKLGRKVLLSFSCGKDSIAAWLAMRDLEIVPYYCYLIPDLEFVETSLEYYEKFFGQRIIRMPHSSLYRWLNNYTFVPPERLQIIEDSSLPDFVYSDTELAVREDTGNELSYSCTGVRAADSPNRRTHFIKHGVMDGIRLKAYPVWDWRNIKLEKTMIEHKCKLPIDYHLFGRSFDGMDYRFLKPIKDNFPKDFEKILEWFPLADLEIFRAEKLIS
jgi:hypothetical protein